jgi:hypothetical protein
MLDSVSPERCSKRTTRGSYYLRCKLGDLIVPFTLIHHPNSRNIDNKELRLDLRCLEQNAAASAAMRARRSLSCRSRSAITLSCCARRSS